MGNTTTLKAMFGSVCCLPILFTVAPLSTLVVENGFHSNFLKTFIHLKEVSQCLMADGLEVPIEAAVELKVVSSFERDGEHEGLILTGVPPLLLLT